MSEISEKSFKQIKIIQDALHNSIKNGYSTETNFDVTNKYIEKHFPGATGMCEALDANDDIMIALNLAFSNDYGGTHIKNTGDDPDYPNFSIQNLSDQVDELLKKGRSGIEKIVNDNNRRFREIRQITDDMDNAFEN